MTNPQHVEAVLQSLRTSETHVTAEYVDDLDGTLASVSREPRYAMMPEPGRVAVVTDNDGVVKFYQASRKQFTPGASRIVAQIATDWYVFLENVPTRLSVPEGKPTTLHTLTLFPKAPDGIRGEFLWERYVTDEAPTGVPRLEGAATHIPAIKVRNLNIHEQYLDALCKGDRKRIAALLDEQCIWAVRSYLTDAKDTPMATAQGAREALALHERWLDCFDLERVSVLNRMVAEWYVFAEELLIVRPKSGPDRGQRRQYRKAAFYPVTPAGRIQGELSYGTELEAPAPSAGTTFGLAYFVRENSFAGAKDLTPRSLG